MQYLASGRSYEHICKRLNMGKSTLSDYRQRAIATGESFQALSQLDDTQLKALLQPPENKKGETSLSLRTHQKIFCRYEKTQK